MNKVLHPKANNGRLTRWKMRVTEGEREVKYLSEINLVDYMNSTNPDTLTNKRTKQGSSNKWIPHSSMFEKTSTRQ